MIEDENCPRCGEALIVEGSIFRRSGFRPERRKVVWLSLQLPEVPVPKRGHGGPPYGAGIQG